MYLKIKKLEYYNCYNYNNAKGWWWYGWYGHVGGGYDMIIMVVLMIVGDGMMVTVMTTMKKLTMLISLLNHMLPYRIWTWEIWMRESTLQNLAVLAFGPKPILGPIVQSLYSHDYLLYCIDSYYNATHILYKH